MVTYKVKLIDNNGLNTTIDVSPSQTIVEAAEDLGLNLAVSCRSGACASCMGRLIAGEVDQSNQSFLDEDRLDACFVLTCVAYPCMDCTIEILSRG